MGRKWATATALALMIFLAACGEEKTAPPAESPTQANANPQPPNVSGDITYQLFPVNDSTGRTSGWGYDLFVNGKRTIHQGIIPAVPGNNAFSTENDARKVAELAVDKMKKSGSLPTITVEDLDSLHIAR